MSEINRSLLAQAAAQEEPDISPIIKKLCGDGPVIDTSAERERFKRDRMQELEERLRAESQKR